jgi:hypothetical protein
MLCRIIYTDRRIPNWIMPKKSVKNPVLYWPHLSAHSRRHLSLLDRTHYGVVELYCTILFSEALDMGVSAYGADAMARGISVCVRRSARPRTWPELKSPVGGAHMDGCLPCAGVHAWFPTIPVPAAVHSTGGATTCNVGHGHGRPPDPVRHATAGVFNFSSPR